jgi:hypothetical protein
VGTTLLTALTVTATNPPTAQEVFALVPYFGHPVLAVLAEDALVVTLAAILLAFQVCPDSRHRPLPKMTTTKC